MKKTFSAELAYVLGLIILALGTALMEKADFGMSMVVAPAYILHLKLVKILPFFSFGMAEYSLQLLLIAALSVTMGKVKRGYLFSFVTAVLYGFTLDAAIFSVSWIGADAFAVRCVLFALGVVLGSVGVSLLLRTYLAPEAYELVVKEVAARYKKSIAGVKTAYDMISLCISVVLSFCFFGFLHFEGVKLGTLITALINGYLIGKLSDWMDKRFEMKDSFPLRKVLEG